MLIKGQYEIIKNEEDFFKIVRENISKEFEEVARELIECSNLSAIDDACNDCPGCK